MSECDCLKYLQGIYRNASYLKQFACCIVLSLVLSLIIVDHVAVLVYELAISVLQLYCYINAMNVHQNSQYFGKVPTNASSVFKAPILVLSFLPLKGKHPNFRHFNQEMTLVDAVFEYCEY